MTRTAISAFSLLVLLCAMPALASEPNGLWLTGEGDSRIKIAPCGTKLCGTLVWLKEPNDSAGQPLRDSNNADPALRTRTLVGLQLFQGLTRSGDKWTGKIYNPDDGKTYDGALTLDGPDKAEISGCVAVVLCQTEVLTRQ